MSNRAASSAAPTRGRASPRARTRARQSHKARPFRAVDGESVTIDGEHRYVVLASSDGDTLQNLDGIPTRECFNWLIRVAKRSPAILVAFGLNYDVNMMLRDVPEDTLRELWQQGQAPVTLGRREYFVEWIPSKLFAVHTDGGSAKVYDTFGFFQSSFVNALKSWGIGADDFLQQMKDRRGSFTADELDEITRYSIHENTLLVELMDNVRAALRDVGLHPRVWHGAGAIASALLAKHGVAEACAKTYGPTARPVTLDEDVLMRAYFGGRTEVFRQGVFESGPIKRKGRYVLVESPIASWDINSAYPSEALDLPVTQGRWRRSRRYEPDQPWAVWRVRWHVADDVVLTPFPFRDKRSIHYPLAGEGWYHAPEVTAAIALYGDAITVTSGYVFEPASDAKPFAFLADVYAERQALKAEGHAGEKVLKLGINSVYGKLAQGNQRGGHRPKFQDYFWAGRITSGTRARALLAGASAVDHLVAIATDGLMFAGGEPELVAAPGLGGWERTLYKDLFVAQPGMYYAHAVSGECVLHSRGFFTKEIRFPRLQRAWLTDGPYGSQECKSERFVGLGSALMRNDFDVWRTWQKGTRRLSLYTSRKFYDPADDGHRARTLLPPSEVRPGFSDRYVPKYAAVELEPEQEEWIQGLEQPMRAF